MVAKKLIVKVIRSHCLRTMKVPTKCYKLWLKRQTGLYPYATECMLACLNEMKNMIVASNSYVWEVTYKFKETFLF